ncbi:MAG: Tn3 family transposase [Ktedonobacteraceae bacterium]|nr:Tn3 family transposase [Ktedonobacteraceae bacterium]
MFCQSVAQRLMLACLDNFVLSAPLSRHWGDGTTSSSDGMRMSVGVKAANAEYNAKHFGVERGTTIYAQAADIWMPFGKPQVIGTNEEALYVIDALENLRPLRRLARREEEDASREAVS